MFDERRSCCGVALHPISSNNNTNDNNDTQVIIVGDYTSDLRAQCSDSLADATTYDLDWLCGIASLWPRKQLANVKAPGALSRQTAFSGVLSLL